MQCQDIILPDNQVVHIANRKKRWYSLAKWQILSTLIATNLESPKCYKKATFVTKIITTINSCAKGWPWWERKAAVMSRSPYNWCLKMQRMSCTRLVLPLNCVALVTQEQMPYMTPNATINVVRPLNASKCKCHLLITMIVIATIIVTCQHVHKTTAALQMNRLQQSTISW